MSSSEFSLKDGHFVLTICTFRGQLAVVFESWEVVLLDVTQSGRTSWFGVVFVCITNYNTTLGLHLVMIRKSREGRVTYFQELSDCTLFRVIVMVYAICKSGYRNPPPMFQVGQRMFGCKVHYLRVLQQHSIYWVGLKSISM